MTLRVAINGFGRIGRNLLRAVKEAGYEDVQIVAVNDLAPVESNAHLLKYDTVHGRYAGEISHEGQTLLVDGQKIQCLSERDPAKLPWGALEIDVVMECTGIFTARDKAALHLEAGAKKVLISAPSGDADRMVVYGVNHADLRKEDKIVSNASCTTNCLAPVAKTLHEGIGITHGFMTTIHSYTGDQNLVDSIHKDMHRARAAALSMIPTSTGAARAVGKVLPALNGKLDGVAMRVPTANVSVVDLKFTAARDTSIDEINTLVKAAADGDLAGVLGYYDEPLVSSDFNHNPLSSIFALNETKVIEDRFCRIMSWYDNEWGFANRMVDTALAMGKLG